MVVLSWKYDDEYSGVVYSNKKGFRDAYKTEVDMN